MFLSSPLLWWRPLSILPNLKFCISPRVLIFYLVVLLLPLFFFPLFILSGAHFSMPNSISIFWLYIILVGLQFFFLFFFANRLMSSMYIILLILIVNIHYVIIIIISHFLEFSYYYKTQILPDKNISILLPKNPGTLSNLYELIFG